MCCRSILEYHKLKQYHMMKTNYKLLNIKNLHYIVFAGGGKAKVKIIQSIGRGLRLHKDKKGVIIIDLADELYYSYQHYTKRLKLYKGEKINYGIKKIKEHTEEKD